MHLVKRETQFCENVDKQSSNKNRPLWSLILVKIWFRIGIQVPGSNPDWKTFEHLWATFSKNMAQPVCKVIKTIFRSITSTKCGMPSLFLHRKTQAEIIEQTDRVRETVRTADPAQLWVWHQDVRECWQLTWLPQAHSPDQSLPLGMEISH